MGSDRLMFSVDYPMDDSLTGAEFLAQYPMDEDAPHGRFSENAARLFGDRIPEL